MKRISAALMVAFVLLAPVSVGAQFDERSAEQRIKAAFLYHFSTFIEWPEHAHRSPRSPIVIGVAGAPGIADDLAELVQGRTAQGRPVRVVRLRPGDGEEVHILFVGRAAAAALPTLVAGTGDGPVLVVTETPGGFAAGAMIELMVHDDRVRFDVAVDALAARELRASSRMLEVARRVVTGR